MPYLSMLFNHFYLYTSQFHLLKLCNFNHRYIKDLGEIRLICEIELSAHIGVLVRYHLIDCVENVFYGECLMINGKIIKHRVVLIF